MGGIDMDWRYRIEERLDKLEAIMKPERVEAKPSVFFKPCHNFQAGRYKPVDTIVYHYTAGTSDAEAIINHWNTLKSPKRVSAHYIIDRNGAITQCVEEKNTAWHAWKWNPESIGIEICAASVENRALPMMDKRMTDEQEASLAWLTKDIMTRHEITRITGHRFLGMNTSCPGNVFPTEESIEEFLEEWGIDVSRD